MFQSHLKKEIDIPKDVQTMLKLCLIIKCQWVQLGSSHLGNNVDQVGWWDVIGWQNFEILNMCHETSLAS
jgi:hypothetical protein